MTKRASASVLQFPRRDKFHDMGTIYRDASPPNLNELELISDGGFQPPDDYSIETNDVSVYFRNLESALIGHILNADCVVGCVAWLTSASILEALAYIEAASIIVQKEDFLRPDVGIDKNGWHHDLRRRYDAIGRVSTRYAFDGVVGQLSVCGDPTIEAVRCVGNHNADKHPAFPRMHNKFCLFCKLEKPDGRNDEVRPYGVWTGSFNFTKNACNSLENALYLTNADVVSAYFSEYQQIVALSEPLDWDSEWCAPQWRIGT